ncbi:Uncharacterized protein dnm_035030 [Desulfonema magnum]|uniref:Uncharacterized protein n=1 Tax=Desulfonema magnum TaxID=45655 RepID=A0A975BKN4_9BACT|nr:Uncharacterized protein dnm_035030 [Desulfonema magnum]
MPRRLKAAKVHEGSFVSLRAFVSLWHLYVSMFSSIKKSCIWRYIIRKIRIVSHVSLNTGIV